MDQHPAEDAAEGGADEAKKTINTGGCAAAGLRNSLGQKCRQKRLEQAVPEEESRAADIQQQVRLSADQIDGITCGCRQPADHDWHAKTAQSFRAAHIREYQ